MHMPCRSAHSAFQASLVSLCWCLLHALDLHPHSVYRATAAAAAAVQRYISLLPVFQSSLDDAAWVHGPAISAEASVVAERLKPLVRLYGSLEETAAIEVCLPVGTCVGLINMPVPVCVRTYGHHTAAAATSIAFGPPTPNVAACPTHGTREGLGGDATRIRPAAVHSLQAQAQSGSLPMECTAVLLLSRRWAACLPSSRSRARRCRCWHPRSSRTA